MPIKLDVKDKKILYELDIDSRQSASQLAKKVGISKQGCTFKINNLVKKGVIKSFIAVINTPLIGHLSFRMYYKLIDITPKEEEEFRNFFINHKDIPWLVGCQGIWDYIAVCFPEDFSGFEQFNVELTNKFGKFIEKKDIALVTVAHHFRSGYILGEKKDLIPLLYAGQPKDTVTLDETEKQILAFLTKDARTSLIEMGKSLSIPSKTISYRIDKLRKSQVIEGYTMTVDYDKIGFERYKMFIRIKNMTPKRENAFIQYSRTHPYLMYYSKSIGENDVELEFIVKNSIHLREIIADIRERFGDLIKSFETLKIYKEYKLDFYPWRKIEKGTKPVKSVSKKTNS
ncbi:MAG: Lrp/AsnC family transcriptional regulator [Nanoarchaeota archaeon]